MALSDFEKSLGAIEETPMDVPQDPAPVLPAAKKPFMERGIVRAVRAPIDSGIGFVKGAADTILSVPRNVQKVVASATQLGVSNDMNDTRQMLVEQNQKLLATYKTIPDGDPRKEKYKTLLKNNIDQIMSLSDEEEAINQQVAQDASWIPGDEGGQHKMAFDEKIAPSNGAQRFGFKAEKIGELIAPSGATAKADIALRGMNVLPQATSTAGKVFNAVARTGARAALDAGVAGASTLGQAAYRGQLDTAEGRDVTVKDIRNNMIFSGAAKAVTAGAGEALKTIKPEIFARSVYKPDAKEVAKELKNQLPAETSNFVKENIKGTSRTLATYDDLIKSGDMTRDQVYKTGKVLTEKAKEQLADDIALKLENEVGGNLGKKLSSQFKTAIAQGDHTLDDLQRIASETVDGTNASTGDDLAKWAVSKGVKGSLKNQYKQVQRILDTTENQVMNSADSANVRIQVDPGMKSFAQDLADEYAGYGRGEIGKSIDEFIGSVGDNGSVSVRDAIKFRRLIDKMRGTASFRNPKVGDNLKYWADDLRGSINSIDGIGDLNSEYAKAIKASTLLEKRIASSGGKMPVGALEMYTAIPEDGKGVLGTAAVIAKRTINSPRVQMGVANLANKAGKASEKTLRRGAAFRRVLPEVARNMQSEDF